MLEEQDAVAEFAQVNCPGVAFHHYMADVANVVRMSATPHPIADGGV